MNSLVRPCSAISPARRAHTWDSSRPAQTWDSREGVILPFHDSHRHWPIYPVCPGASTSPAPWPPLTQTQQQRGLAMAAGGSKPPTKEVSSLTDVQRRQQAAQPPRAGRCPLSPLSCTLAWCPGIPAHSLELSSAGQLCGAAGGGQATCPPPRKQASPHPSPMLPGIPHGCSVQGVPRVSQGAVACWSPSHLPPAHRAGGWAGLAAAPAWAQGT